MDNIVVRQLRFDFGQAEHRCVWSQSSPEFSMFLNALGLHVPYFERFLVKVMRQYRDALTDPTLATDVKAIIGQEAHHAYNFVRWNQVLCARYPNLRRLEQSAESFFQTVHLTPAASSSRLDLPQAMKPSPFWAA